MECDIFRHILDAAAGPEPFAVATVIAVRGSASAKPGSKALINAEGRNVYGWVGGGCADAYVREQAVEAMREGRPRIVVANLDDEVFGLGMPCGGVMDVYIEPHAAPTILNLDVPAPLQAMALHLANGLGYQLQVTDSDEELDLKAFLLALGAGIAHQRQKTFAPLASKAMQSGKFTRVTPSALVLCGASRITEELARLGTLLKWPVTLYGGNPDTGGYPEATTFVPIAAGFRNFHVPEDAAVVVASHHKGDPDYIRLAVESGASYVGMVASRKRSLLVLEDVRESVDTTRVSAPAGLDLGCRAPADIALSVICEILSLTP